MVSTFEGDTLSLAVADYALTLTVKQIERNWDALSHYPDRRARIELGALHERIEAFAAHVDRTIAIGGTLDRDGELLRFVQRHVSITRRAWAMDSRCMSWFIVGPARFPTDRNRKRMDWADNAHRATGEHLKAAKNAVERSAFPYGMPGDAIRANNRGAPELIKAKIAELRKKHGQMKAANAAIRSAKAGDVEAMVQAVMDATGWRDGTARLVVCPPQAWMGRGFAAYQLSGELAEIKRLEDRLGSIERNRERGTVSKTHNTSIGAVEVVENGDAARIQILFDGKPDSTTRDLLKGNGFRWAPSEGAWQRHLNNNGRYAAQYVISKLQAENRAA